MPTRERQATGTTVVGIFETVDVGHLKSFSDHADLGRVVVLVLSDDVATECLGVPCVSRDSARAEVVAHMRGVSEVHVVGRSQLLWLMRYRRDEWPLVLAEECVHQLVEDISRAAVEVTTIDLEADADRNRVTV